MDWQTDPERATRANWCLLLCTWLSQYIVMPIHWVHEDLGCTMCGIPHLPLHQNSLGFRMGRVWELWRNQVQLQDCRVKIINKEEGLRLAPPRGCDTPHCSARESTRSSVTPPGLVESPSSVSHCLPILILFNSINYEMGGWVDGWSFFLFVSCPGEKLVPRPRELW
jgi:hypothetical protein